MDKKLKDLLFRKKELFMEIKEMTKNVKIEEDIESADRYEKLFAKREKLFKTISELDEEIKNMPQNSEEINAVNIEIKNIVKDIIKLDEILKEKGKKIQIMLTSGIKEVKQGKKTSKAYNIEYSEISKFDSKG